MLRSIVSDPEKVKSHLNPNLEFGANPHELPTKLEIPPAIVSICEDIKELGGKALLIGGFVRDSVINQVHPEYQLKPKDFDIEIYGISKSDVLKYLSTKYGNEKIDQVGKAFGVFKVSEPNLSEALDISVTRKDNSTSDVLDDPSMTILEAARRRDLRINSVSYDPLTNTLYDPFNGLADIKEKFIRVTDPEFFVQDPVRVLRVMQFISRFKFDADTQTEQLCKLVVENKKLEVREWHINSSAYTHADVFKKGSKPLFEGNVPEERVSEEFSKLLLKGLKPSLGLEFARRIGYINKYFPELSMLVGCQQEPQWHPEGDAWAHTLQVLDASSEIIREQAQLGNPLSNDTKLVLLLGAICHDLGKAEKTTRTNGRITSAGHEPAGLEPARIFLSKLNPTSFSDEVKLGVLAMVAEHMRPRDLWEQAQKDSKYNHKKVLVRLAQRLDGKKTNIFTLSLMAEADQRGRNPDLTTTDPLKRDQVPDLAAWSTWINTKSKELNVSKKLPPRLLTGTELMAFLKIHSGGPDIGVTLDAVYQDQLEGYINTPAEALSKAKEYWEYVQNLLKDIMEDQQVDRKTALSLLREKAFKNNAD